MKIKQIGVALLWKYAGHDGTGLIKATAFHLASEKKVSVIVPGLPYLSHRFQAVSKGAAMTSGKGPDISVIGSDVHRALLACESEADSRIDLSKLLCVCSCVPECHSGLFLYLFEKGVGHGSEYADKIVWQFAEHPVTVRVLHAAFDHLPAHVIPCILKGGADGGGGLMLKRIQPMPSELFRHLLDHWMDHLLALPDGGGDVAAFLVLSGGSGDLRAPLSLIIASGLDGPGDDQGRTLKARVNRLIEGFFCLLHYVIVYLGHGGGDGHLSLQKSVKTFDYITDNEFLAWVRKIMLNHPFNNCVTYPDGYIALLALCEDEFSNRLPDFGWIWDHIVHAKTINRVENVFRYIAHCFSACDGVGE